LEIYEVGLPEGLNMKAPGGFRFSLWSLFDLISHHIPLQEPERRFSNAKDYFFIVYFSFVSLNNMGTRKGRCSGLECGRQVDFHW
jgi:hypothetical protein